MKRFNSVTLKVLNYFGYLKIKCMFMATFLGVNRVYSPVITLAATVQFSSAQTQLSWSQKGEPPISPLGAWYLDDIIVSNANANMFNDSFESNQIE